MNSQTAIASLGNSELLARTRELVERSSRVEADLLLHLAEVDERKLYRDLAFPSMFAYCVDELGFSEDAAYNRIFVARASRRFPALLDAIRSARLHLHGARLVAAHLTEQNCAALLAEAARKSSRDIERIVARLSPRPPVPTIVRHVLDASASALSVPSAAALPADGLALRAVAPPPGDTNPVPVGPVRGEPHRPVVAPLSETTFKIQFTASSAFHAKLREAQALLRHRIPSGDIVAALESGLEVLIDKLKKERFAVGCKPRSNGANDEAEPASRHIPNAIKREVFERDEGRCTFTDDQGRRCPEIGFLEFDHVDGFARNPVHEPDRIRLLCRSHNQLAAERMYGGEFMSRVRSKRPAPSTCFATSPRRPDS
jgi:hypothetical protein